MSHPRAALHNCLTSPVRLSLLAALLDYDEVEFAVVRDLLGVADPVLSKHMSALEEVGYAVVRKGHVGKRPRTWLGVTAEGRRAYREHRAALLAILREPG